MYLAMNRFTVQTENAPAFEEVWLNRESHLQKMDGFVSFHMLKGAESDGTTLYASHTVWETEAQFRAWTTSAAFREAHARAGQTTKLHQGAPRFEGFTAIQSIAASEAA